MARLGEEAGARFGAERVRREALEASLRRGESEAQGRISKLTARTEQQKQEDEATRAALQRAEVEQRRQQEELRTIGHAGIAREQALVQSRCDVAAL